MRPYQEFTYTTCNFRQLSKRNRVTGLERHVVAIKQILRINRGRFALPRQDDFLRISLAGVICRDDGLRERQSLRPLDFGVLHRADDDYVYMLRGGDAGIRVALSGQVSRPHVGLGL